MRSRKVVRVSENGDAVVVVGLWVGSSDRVERGGGGGDLRGGVRVEGSLRRDVGRSERNEGSFPVAGHRFRRRIRVTNFATDLLTRTADPIFAPSFATFLARISLFEFAAGEMGFVPSRSLPTLPRPLAIVAGQIADSLDDLASFVKTTKNPIARLRAAPGDSGYNSEVDSDHRGAPQVLDQFERKFVQNWLLLLLKRGDDWIDAAGSSGDKEEVGDGDLSDEREQRESSIEFAAALLSSFAETSGESRST